MKKTAIWFLLALIFIACGDEEEPELEAKGSIFVTVRFNGELISDAQITTEPVTSTVTTDLTGSAIISDVPVGGYKVNAVHPDIGIGSAPVTVTADAVMDVNVNLLGGVFEAPSVFIQSLIDFTPFNLGETIQFTASVSDESDSPETLKISWTSSIDGELNTDPASSAGIATFQTNSLSEGEHLISIIATDSDNIEGSDQRFIRITNLPDAVTLNPITASAAGLELNWSVSTESEFNNYKVTRSENEFGPFQNISVISDINTTTFTDSDVKFDNTYYYQIAVSVNDGTTSVSNIESQMFEGDNIDVGASVIRMIIDPERPYIYALDQINNSMLFINKETKSVVKTIFVGSSPTDLDMNEDGTKAYIANLGSTQIAVVDLESQEKIDDLFVDTQAGSWDGNPYSVVWLQGNYLAYTSEDQWNNIKVVNANTGSLVSFTGSIHTPFLETNPSKTIIYAIDGSDVIRFNINSSGILSEVDETDISGFGSRKVAVSKNGQFIFRGRSKILANNFSTVVGTFGENIYATNNDGSIAIGETNIWNGENFSIKSILPVESKIMELDYDNETLYVYDNSTSKIYIIKVN